MPISKQGQRFEVTPVSALRAWRWQATLGAGVMAAAFGARGGVTLVVACGCVFIVGATLVSVMNYRYRRTTAITADATSIVQRSRGKEIRVNRAPVSSVGSTSDNRHAVGGARAKITLRDAHGREVACLFGAMFLRSEVETFFAALDIGVSRA